ncbi:hypothetical protein [Hymenobacter sp. BT491]|uniref:hypothetical protein n=1 Tax=Hymenobacter sp. BT491 TaxID=2766779 RepID=UPI001653C0C9|nr:hypothetical protein [Hymenobacter sp. BT491]MBC6988991.1 hypothetical protein [Hymenobacter sp. BT491]
MKRFLKRYFDLTQSWGVPVNRTFFFRPWKEFYCYIWPQRCTHSAVLKPGIWVVTQVDYFWLNMVYKVYYTRPMNSNG